jgi:hypothetical protein
MLYPISSPRGSVAKSVLGGTPLAPVITAPVHLTTYAAWRNISWPRARANPV